MKKIILKILFTILIISSYTSPSLSQEELSYVTIENDNLIWVLNRVKILKEFSTDILSIRVLEVTNESGSAGFDNCEVTSTIYITVSEDGEYPEQKLYKLTPVYNPKIEKSEVKKYSPIIYLSYGPLKNPKKIKIVISLNKLSIIKTLENKNTINTDTLNISNNTILFFSISQQEYDILSSNKKSEIDEVLSDFNFYSKKITEILTNKNINTNFIKSVKFHLEYDSGNFYSFNRSNFEHIVGTILMDAIKEPKVLYGVYTDIDLLEEINKYFNIR